MQIKGVFYFDSKIKQDNTHFHRLLNEYHYVAKLVYRMGNGSENG
ncbi:MAG: hypothetical protein ACJA0E_001233 [Bermanella sp.]|jgi:uncharacterized protein YdcH (DUF465 family)